jgi:CheY-like chemotaxis protein
MDKVLIVDNDAQLLVILTEYFQRYSNKFEIITVKDGLAAIKALQKQRFSIVVTETKIPIVNGLVLLAYMAKNYPKVPCIIMTGYKMKPFLKKRFQKEASHYIEKPFELTDLARAIMSVLGHQEIVAGTLNGISVVAFLELIEMECLTCLCEISSRNGRKGYLLLDSGSLHNAFYGKLRGQKAALKLLQMKNVAIRFGKLPKKKIPRQIETRLSDLLVEAMRSKDEKESTKEKRR